MPPLSHQYLKLQTLDVQLDPTPLLVSVRTLIEAVKLEFKAQGFETQLPEFQVFFNDHVANDFNTLFKAFPIDRT
ncbi:S-adenosyl-L-methionine-dependent methyltransferases superfamily protein [Prunus dulcis]|uniref:S-adenosyl-L-methionine-dependent methyltransferases superfamily protein n=1 Tax=Prunus dulcis TaxID=3755 RepID=A0A4Y1QRN4_PRUDU|nr:S-adenosyl-L-methionine-dependent methyltransferases superfamily protein [Prunus dulcis]